MKKTILILSVCLLVINVFSQNFQTKNLPLQENARGEISVKEETAKELPYSIEEKALPYMVLVAEAIKNPGDTIFSDKIISPRFVGMQGIFYKKVIKAVPGVVLEENVICYVKSDKTTIDFSLLTVFILISMVFMVVSNICYKNSSAVYFIPVFSIIFIVAVILIIMFPSNVFSDAIRTYATIAFLASVFIFGKDNKYTYAILAVIYYLSMLALLLSLYGVI